MPKYEYSGYTWRKKRQDVVNKIRGRRIKGKILSVKFNKTKTKYGWKWKATIEKRR